MTGRAMDSGWGERREGTARRRRWAMLALVALLCGAAVLVLPFASNGHMVFGPDQPTMRAPGWMRLAAGSALTLVLLAAARVNWRRSDEVRRASIGRFWAVIGLATCASFPLVHVLGPMLDDRGRLGFVYAIALGAGCLDSAWRRWRGKAVWG